MKSWSLRLRLTLWSAIFFAAAVVLLGAFTMTLARKHQVASLDAELLAATRTFFHELYEHGPAGVAHAIAEMDKDTRSVVLGGDGALLWASPELKAERFTGAPAGLRTAGPWRVLSTVENGYTVRIAHGFEDVDATVADVRRAYLTALPVLLLLVAGGAWWLVRLALRPVQDIGEAARRITTEHLDDRLPNPPRQDELGQLTATLNEMLGRLDRGFRQAIRFTADASHELRTPLALIGAGLEELLRRRDLPPGMSPSLASLLDDCRRLNAVCQDLLVLARADAGRLTLDHQRQNLCALIEAAVEDAQILAGERVLTFDVDLPDRAEDRLDARYFTRILLNLLGNAVKFNRDGGTVRLRLSADERLWKVEIANTGPGIPPEHQPRLFERFFRADNSAAIAGHGLGLSLSRELARAHGGDLVLVGSDATWVTFRLTLQRTIFERRPAPAAVAAEHAEKSFR